MRYYILKQFIPNADVWVVKLTTDDTVYSYDTLEEAVTALITVGPLYPENQLKIQQMGSAGL